eukprot:206813-Pelagomonas_calceolata.AAC.1
MEGSVASDADTANAKSKPCAWELHECTNAPEASHRQTSALTRGPRKFGDREACMVQQTVSPWTHPETDVDPGLSP